MKLGIIGSGMIVKELLSIAGFLTDVELTAICGTTKSREKVEGLKNEYGIKQTVYSYDDLLALDLDAVYIGLPNHLHFEFARKALLADKNVIVEKPFTVNAKEAEALCNLAKEKNVFLFEAITNQYLPNYRKIKEILPSIGKVKIVQCNYSQYSSRYDKFKAGVILPAFNPEFAGGALMDLNIYNIHFVAGLFGRPENVEYYPNLERGIDTSGVLIMDYGSFKCVCVAAKDCKAPIANNIQGDNGCIYQDNPTNVCEGFEILLNDGSVQKVNENMYEHRMVHEFIEFFDLIKKGDTKQCYDMLAHSLLVSEIQTTARTKSGLVFPNDEKLQ